MSRKRDLNRQTLPWKLEGQTCSNNGISVPAFSHFGTNQDALTFSCSEFHNGQSRLDDGYNRRRDTLWPSSTFVPVSSASIWDLSLDQKKGMIHDKLLHVNENVKQRKGASLRSFRSIQIAQNCTCTLLHKFNVSFRSLNSKLFYCLHLNVLVIVPCLNLNVQDPRITKLHSKCDCWNCKRKFPKNVTTLFR